MTTTAITHQSTLVRVAHISGWRTLRVNLSEIEVIHPVPGYTAYWYQGERVVLTAEQKAAQALHDAGLPATAETTRALRDLAQALRRDPLRVEGQCGVTAALLRLALSLAGFSLVQEEPFADWDNGPGVYAYQGRARRLGLSQRGIPWHFCLESEDDEIASVTPGPPWWKRTLLDTGDFHDLVAQLWRTPRQVAHIAVSENAAGETVVVLLAGPNPGAR